MSRDLLQSILQPKATSYFLVQSLQSTRLSTAAAADQTASIDSELRHAVDV